MLGYALQLVLGALQLLVSASLREDGTIPEEWTTDLGVVVTAAREAADDAGRNAALALLASLARARPADALQHVLEVRACLFALGARSCVASLMWAVCVLVSAAHPRTCF